MVRKINTGTRDGGRDSRDSKTFGGTTQVTAAAAAAADILSKIADSEATPTPTIMTSTRFNSNDVGEVGESHVTVELVEESVESSDFEEALEERPVVVSSDSDGDDYEEQQQMANTLSWNMSRVAETSAEAMETLASMAVEMLEDSELPQANAAKPDMLSAAMQAVEIPLKTFKARKTTHKSEYSLYL